ncbi:MAG TPA: serine/threonine-protein kinase [Kofleriaceae bacterium]|nr:serine/threonine-protein kinase [Kofleriaceae bacterium]
MESIEPGQILAGKFQIERVLGKGGMGVVVAAQHLQLGQLVALKFLLPEALRNPEVTERFLREARAAVRLKSEHVGRVIDVGTLETGAPYLVMEYLEGQDLDSFRKANQRLPVAQVVSFVLQAAEAIAEAHAIGIIHRDLKPANLFLTVRADGSPSVKVLDFGIAKATEGSEDFSLTKTAAVMGSPAYMSPEQLRSARDVDARADIWAMGVILHELVEGAQPFAADTITELTLKVAMDPTPALKVPTPPGFAEIVARCLEKDPAKRYASVAELAAALAPFGPPGSAEVAQRVARIQAGVMTRARSAVSPAVVGAATTLSGGAGQTSGGEGKRKLGWWVGLAAGLVAIAAMALVLAIRGGGGDKRDGKQAGSGSLTGSATGAATGTGTGTGTTTGSGTATTTGSGAGTPSLAGTGVATASGSATAAGSGAGSAAATGSGTGSATASDTGSAGGSAAGTGSGSGSGSGSAETAGTGSGSEVASTPGSGAGSARVIKRGGRHGEKPGSGSGSGSDSAPVDLGASRQ